ncbi:MAG: RNA-binding cell elongation regulator Jag/EloR [bacterium]
MKRIVMKGKNVDDAVEAALKVLGGEREQAKVVVLSKGKAGMLGMIGGEEAEVEVVLKGSKQDDAKDTLQDILDKMTFVSMVEASIDGEYIKLDIKGEDMGRIIGKDGATLRSLEILVGSIVSRLHDDRVRVNIDADGYKDKRNNSLERLAKDVADEVQQTGQEKVLPPMTPADRRIVHMYLKDNPEVTSYSKGEGRERRLIVAPK